MIYINDIASFRDPESEIFTPDDRLEKVELIGDVLIQDMGRVEAGDVFSVKCLFSKENYSRIEALWLSRAKVRYTDIGGDVWTNLLVKVVETERDRNFPEYILVTFELWRAKNG